MTTDTMITRRNGCCDYYRHPTVLPAHTAGSHALTMGSITACHRAGCTTRRLQVPFAFAGMA